MAPFWEDPRALAINRRRSHTPLRSYKLSEQAVRHLAQPPQQQQHPCPTESSEQLLSGCSWKFRLFRNPNEVPSGVYQPEYDDSSFGTIPVPGNWECHGHGTPIYTNFVYPIPVDPPTVPKDDNPTGVYRHCFAVQGYSSTSSRRYFLVIGGADSCALVWLNGAFVGACKDSRLPSEWEVSDVLKSSGNVLVVQVVRWSDATYLEDQDMWRLSGIHRHVTLLSKPTSACIIDYTIKTPLSFEPGCGGPLLTAGLDVSVYLEHLKKPDPPSPAAAAAAATAVDGLHVTADLLLQNGSTLLRDLTMQIQQRWYARDEASGSSGSSAAPTGILAHLHIPDVAAALAAAGSSHKLQLWSAEQPFLYILLLKVAIPAAAAAAAGGSSKDPGSSSSSGYEDIEVEGCLFGFRQTWVQDGRLLHNNVPLLLRGVNRHEWHDIWGKVCDQDHMIRDIKLMKAANFNAVRCSHYPNDSRWYDLCNYYGLYVIDEANIETHGFDPTFVHDKNHPAHHEVWLPAMMSRATRMYDRDKNQPCIVMWSLGNEAGYGAAHDAMAAWLRRMDPTRPVHYEGGGSRTAATDVISPMYARIHQLQQLAADAAAAGDKRPVMLCEYAHSMGNSTGNLAEYWRCFEDSIAAAEGRGNCIIGGFIWDWADQALLKREKVSDGREIEYWAVGGDFGDQPNDAQFCCNGLVFPDRTPHPAYYEAAACMSPVTFALCNTSELSYDKMVSEGLEVIVKNKYSFLDTSHLVISWRLMVASQPVLLPAAAAAAAEQRAEGWMITKPDQPVAPGRQETMQLLCKNSDVVAAAQAAAAAAAGSSLPAAAAAAVGIDIVLEMRAALAAECNWAKSGHIVSWQQLPLFTIPNASNFRTAAAAAAAAGSLTVSSSDDKITVTGSNDLHLTVTTASGSIAGFSIAGTDLIKTLDPCFMRATTDNDRGGFGGSSYAARWAAAGLDRLAVQGKAVIKVEEQAADSVTISSSYTLTPQAAAAAAAVGAAATAAGVGEFGGAHWFADNAQPATAAAVEDDAGGNAASNHHPATAAAAAAAETECTAIPETGEAAVAAAAAESQQPNSQIITGEGHIYVTAKITVTSTGTVTTHWEFDATSALPANLPAGLLPSLPRVGVHALLPAGSSAADVAAVGDYDSSLCNVTWYGLGPHECYPDRKASARLQIHNMPVGELHVPYIFPQECGGRSDVRWLQMTLPPAPAAAAVAGKCKGLLIASSDGHPLQMNASLYSWQQLTAAMHQHDLQPDCQDNSRCIHLHLDVAHMGVGGDDSWSPSVHEKYLVKPGCCNMSLTMQPLL